MDYVSGPNNEMRDCPFCVDRLTASEHPGLIVYAGALTYATLNLYPYNNGHLMVLPYRHVGDIVDLDEDEANNLVRVLTQARRALASALQPDGYNVGMNLGQAAGAGIPDHLHFHIVPRWDGDTNFMPVTADTKVLPESLDQTRQKVIEAWPAEE